MKRRILVTLLTICMASVFMAGCGEEPKLESSGIIAERPSEETTEVSEETSEESEGIVLVPTKFEVFTDGEPHEVLFHADMDYLYYDEFTSLSRPEHGIESVSFPTEFVNIEGEMRRVDSNDFIDLKYDMVTPIDATSLSFIEDDGYGVMIPDVGICGIIDREFSYAGEVPTIEEVSPFVKGYGIGSWDELFYEMSEDGEVMYASYCRVSFGENYYYGGYAFRMKEGRAQGIYIAVAGDDIEDGMGYIRYAMQSLRFTK